MEFIEHSQTKREDKRYDGWGEWIRKPRGCLKVWTDINKSKTFWQSQTTDRLNLIIKRRTIKVKGKDFCKFL